MSNNQITGTIPAQLSVLTSLERLYVAVGVWYHALVYELIVEVHRKHAAVPPNP